MLTDGGVLLMDTMSCAEEAAPAPSVTVRVILYKAGTPAGAVKTCAGSGKSLTSEPSPKSQAKARGRPSGSDEPLPVNWTLSGPSPKVLSDEATALGG